ncbi:MAG: penicillin-binding protein activator LpoB [Gemmatimonadota bacterium]|nr:MAG: penicillin-binding protein activator LpoB [Gemmatimonadota bacterium]
MQGNAVRVVRAAALFVLAAAVLAGCGKKVRRIDPETTTDLSGFWNDTDSRLVADDMINDCLTHPWIQQHVIDYDGKPVVIVGTVRNRSMEHIATGTFIRDLERAFVNSGQVRVVANPWEREELRGEREEQQDWAREETRKQLRAETGADYMLNGAIDVIVDKEGGREVKFYQVDLYLTHIETNERAWIGQTEIKKEISRSGIGF